MTCVLVLLWTCDAFSGRLITYPEEEGVVEFVKRQHILETTFSTHEQRLFTSWLDSTRPMVSDHDISIRIYGRLDRIASQSSAILYCASMHYNS